METKEFISKWKGGIEMVTPLQRAKVDLISYSIIIIGMILGIIINIRAKVWWLVIVLSGSLLLLVMTYLSAIQKYKMLNKFEQEVKQNE
jgi:uncharacterized membrane protein YoaK (UPF0700 family)